MNEPAPMGHNLPDAFLELEKRVNDLAANADEWLKIEIDESNEGSADDVKGQIIKALKKVKAAREEEKRPYLEAGRVVDTRYKFLTATLEKARDLLQPKLTAWLQTKQRKQDEEARRLADEARRAEEAAAKALAETQEANQVVAAVQADAAVAEAEEARKLADDAASTKARVQGDYTGKARSLRTSWHAEITNLDEAFQYYRENPAVAQLLIKLASADARGGRRRIPGFRVFDTQQAA